MTFSTKIPYSKMFLPELFFICQPIFKRHAAHFATNKMLNGVKKIFYLHLYSCKVSAKAIIRY